MRMAKPHYPLVNGDLNGYREMDRTTLYSKERKVLTTQMHFILLAGIGTGYWCQIISHYVWTQKAIFIQWLNHVLPSNSDHWVVNTAQRFDQQFDYS